MSLLALPRELRDMVYAYTLAVDGLILMKKPTEQPSFVARRHDSQGEEVNQLKYVCRQLYHETKGMELELNKVTAVQSIIGSTEGSLEAFEFFLTTCSPYYQSKLRRVVLWEHIEVKPHGESLTSLTNLRTRLTRSPLASFCAQNPHCAVTLRIAPLDLRLNPVYWCVTGSILQYIVRGSMPEIAGARIQAGILHRFGVYEPCLPSNLRLFPDASVQDAEKYRFPRGLYGPTRREQLPGQMMKWCADGF